MIFIFYIQCMRFIVTFGIIGHPCLTCHFFVRILIKIIQCAKPMVMTCIFYYYSLYISWEGFFLNDPPVSSSSTFLWLFNMNGDFLLHFLISSTFHFIYSVFVCPLFWFAVVVVSTTDALLLCFNCSVNKSSRNNNNSTYHWVPRVCFFCERYVTLKLILSISGITDLSLFGERCTNKSYRPGISIKKNSQNKSK